VTNGTPIFRLRIVFQTRRKSLFFQRNTKYTQKFVNVLVSVSVARQKCKINLIPLKIFLANVFLADDLQRCNSHKRRVILPNSVAFEADYVKVVEDTPVLSAVEM